MRMRSILQDILSSLLIILLCGCAHMHHKTPKINILAEENHHLAPFSKVIVKGNINVKLHTGVQKPLVLMHGETESLNNTLWTVRDDVLYVIVGKGYPKQGEITVDIGTNQLRSFTYRGMGRIIGDNINSRALSLDINNRGQTGLSGHIALYKVVLGGKTTLHVNGLESRFLQLKLKNNAKAQLIGMANVVSLHMQDSSWLSMYWVKSKVLTIRAKDNAFLQLAGITPVLNATLWGNARFNGRYLRAKRAFVKTYDHSEADICVLYSQHTLASGSSNIYYYDLPIFKTDFMAFSGSVLDLRPWGIWNRKEPTRYNHP